MLDFYAVLLVFTMKKLIFILILEFHTKYNRSGSPA
jgi:hypothetical protein